MKNKSDSYIQKLKESIINLAYVNEKSEKIKGDIFLIFKDTLKGSSVVNDDCLTVFYYLADKRKLDIDSSEWSEEEEVAFSTLVKNNMDLDTIFQELQIERKHKEIELKKVIGDYDVFIKCAAEF